MKKIVWAQHWTYDGKSSFKNSYFPKFESKISYEPGLRVLKLGFFSVFVKQINVNFKMYAKKTLNHKIKFTCNAAKIKFFN